jgi:hypothetical protein
VSLEEERERARMAGELDGASGGAAAPVMADESDMDAELRAAMALSMGDAAGGAMDVDDSAPPRDVSAMTEEEMIAHAMAMSMAGVEGGAMETEGEGGSSATAAASEANAAEVRSTRTSCCCARSLASLLLIFDPVVGVPLAAVSPSASYSTLLTDPRHSTLPFCDNIV